MSESAVVTSETQVSHTDERGRTLSGMGADVAQLEATMERHAPESDASPAGAAVAPAADGGDGVAAPAPPKPARGAQRFADLTHERDAAKADAAAAKAERETLARERDELKARLSQPAPAAEPAKPAVVAQPTGEKFTFPSYDAYLETHPNADYNEWEVDRLVAFGDWKDARTDLDGRIRQTFEQEQAARRADEVVTRTRAKGREAYPDFDTVLTSGAGASVNLGPTEAQAKQRCAAIFQHPQSEHLQYAIMKDGDLARSLGALDDIAFGMALARLVPAAQPERRVHTPPPAPYTPVNGSSATTSTPSSELAGKGFDYDSSGYREKRAAERKAKSRY
jgi:hypothetical protein